MKSEPTVSVIIPTHNRGASLKRTLDALCLQSYPLEEIEVLAVTDGCTDGTIAMLRHYVAPFSLKVVEQSNRGAAAARNRGAEQAKGQLLLFLDDDVEPTPLLVEAHVRAHRHSSGQVVIGPYPPALESHVDFCTMVQHAWWNAIFDSMGQSGHRFAFTDLCGGNVSIAPDLFFQVGRFNPAFRCHEDHELGVRLIKTGVKFFFASDALGYHHENSGLGRSFVRKYEEGRADVQMARLHPEILQALPWARYQLAPAISTRLLRAVAFTGPRIGDALAGCFRRGLELLERLRLRDVWKQLYHQVQDYWYWCGVAEESGGREALAAVMANKACFYREGTEIELDLCEGLDRAERRLDKERPLAARIRYGSMDVGFVPRQPGAEPLRGAHLRSILTKSFAVPLLEALALAGAIRESETPERRKLAMLIRGRSSRFGQTEARKDWAEQYNQWLNLEGRQLEDGFLFWEQQNRIRDLVNDKAGLATQLADWENLAEEREKMIQRHQASIRELELEKMSLERDWHYWQSLARTKQDTPNENQVSE